MRVLHRLLLVFGLLVLVTLPLSAPGQTVRSTPEAMTLEIESALTKRLASLENLVADKKWNEVATLLRQTPAEKPDKLVPIAPGWYVSVARSCQCLAALLPPAGLEAYRRQVDAVAKSWLEEADRSSNLDPLEQRAAWLRIVRNGCASSWGDDALARLAEHSFEAGDFAAARSYWEMLLPALGSLRSAAGSGLLRHPAPSHDPAQIRAQLVLCSLFAGDRPRAARELAAFQRLHGNATGRLNGQDGALVDLLAVASQNISVNAAASRVPLEVDCRRWSATLPPPVWSSPPQSDTSDFGEVLPAFIGDTLVASNGESVFAFDLATGRPKWSDATDVAGDSRAAVVHSLADPVRPKWPVIGRVWHSLTVHGDRVYARLGTPITGRAKQEAHWHNELVGLDFGAGEGQLVWRVAAEDLDVQDPLAASSPWCFEDSPAADARRVYVVMRRSLPQEQLNVACFDADSARMLWNRKVGVTVASTEETVNSASRLRLTLAEDSVFLSTDSGAIAALDAYDGAIRWVRTYASETLLSSRRGRRAGHTPPLYHQGVLFVAPQDSNLLMAVHAESGLLLWQREWPDPIEHLLGVSENTLVVQGRWLWGVECETGEPAWPHRRVGYEDPEGQSFGRGMLVEDDVWWPNRDEIIVAHVASGQIVRRVALKPLLGQTAGHLVFSGRSLVIARGSQITVLGSCP